MFFYAFSRSLFYLIQVTWIRHRDLHLLTVDKTTYTSDNRFVCVNNKQIGDWSLQVCINKYIFPKNKKKKSTKSAYIASKEHHNHNHTTKPLGKSDFRFGCSLTHIFRLNLLGLIDTTGNSQVQNPEIRFPIFCVCVVCKWREFPPLKSFPSSIMNIFTVL